MSGCGGNCTCGAGAPQATAIASVNGIALHADGERPDPADLRERAWAELLRQEAVRQGRLPRRAGLLAPGLRAGDQAVLQDMLEQAVPLRPPGEAECARYHAAHAQRFRLGRRARVRHILFALTPGVDVGALAGRAEQVLRELLRQDTPPGRFAERARQLSNCPSGQAGGDLGWLAPDELAQELTRALFGDDPPQGMIPRLVHSRHGLHVMEVLEREAGHVLPYAEVRGRIAAELAQRARATALHRYIRLLAGQARLEGIDLEGAAAPRHGASPGTGNRPA